MKLQLGDQAPSFSLPDQNGTQHTLEQYKGSWVLLYFYPKDNTPGCTVQARGIKSEWSEFEENNITVLGVSKDSVKSHKGFCDRFDLPFTLLSDEEKVVLQDYGVWVEKSMFGKKYMGIQRSSFLIDPEGKIAAIYEKAKPKSHAKDVLKDWKKLKNA